MAKMICPKYKECKPCIAIYNHSFPHLLHWSCHQIAPRDCPDCIPYEPEECEECTDLIDDDWATMKPLGFVYGIKPDKQGFESRRLEDKQFLALDLSRWLDSRTYDLLPEGGK